MYNKIANYYDELGWGDYSNQVIDIINNLLMSNNIIPERVYDIGCGSGELIYKLNQIHDDAKYVGIDISEDMINVAKKKCKSMNNVSFYTKDMRDFKFDKRSNVALCMFDTINHLIKKEHWEEALGSIYNSLKYGGTFIFDVIPKGGIASYQGEYVSDLKEGTLIRRISLDKDNNILTTRINAFIKTNYFGTYKNIREDVRETAFDIKEVISMLKKAGFKKIELYDFNLKRHKMLGNANKLERVFISALK